MQNEVDEGNEVDGQRTRPTQHSSLSISFIITSPSL